MNLNSFFLTVCAWAIHLGGLFASEIPVSSVPPGGLATSDVPQFIHITLDDSTTMATYEGIESIVGHTNPDGSPAAFTFFVSLDGPDFYLTHRLHAAGNEVAIHTVSHTTGNETILDDWVREMASCRRALARYSQIPLADMRGFRAPFLAYNAATFKALEALDFVYESSVTETIPGLQSSGYDSFIWPYTLHDGIQQNTWTGTPPSEPLPELIEVPMWSLQDGNGLHIMDPSTPSKEHLVDMLKTNFTTRYRNNRVPLALWLHAGWLGNSDNVEGLNEFLTWARTHDHVWIVPVGKMVDWVRNPLPVTDPAVTSMLHVATYEPIPTPLTNTLASTIRTVGEYAPELVTPYNQFLQTLETPSLLEAVVVIADDWGSAFEARVVVNYPGTNTITNWSIQLDTLGVGISSFWGNSRLVTGDNTVTLESSGGWESAIEGGTVDRVIGGFLASGASENLRVTNIVVRTQQAVAPELEWERDATTGRLRLRWQTCAPIYELQGRASLSEGQWEDVQRLYMDLEVELPEPSPHRFFRLLSIH